MKKILVLEDDRLLNKGVTFALKQEGYNVISAFSKAEGKNIILNEKLDFLLLDINLPDGTGLDLCREIKEQIDCPIVFFTANDTEADMIRGFECGCDDYIGKPFSVTLLKHKINAIIRRSGTNDKDIFVYKDLKIDFNKKKVLLKEIEISLTVTEYKLLELLAKNKKKVLTKEILLEKVWDNSGNFVDENTLSVNIRRLRKKIEENPKKPEYVVTSFGIGYSFGE